MRLGSYAVRAGAGLAGAARSTARPTIHERHRHRYEFNCLYETDARPSTACAFPGGRPTASSSRSPSCRAIPWYLAVQFHPEFKSKPTRPHPLFAASSTPATQHKTARRGAAPDRPSRWPEPWIRRHAVGDMVDSAAGARSSSSPGPCVIESEAHATALAGALVEITRARRHPVHLQGVVRQGEPHVGPIVPRTRPRRRPARPRGDQGALRRADPDRHPRAGAGRRRRPTSPTSCRFRRSSRRQTDLHRRRRAGPAASSTSRRASSSRPTT